MHVCYPLILFYAPILIETPIKHLHGVLEKCPSLLANVPGEDGVKPHFEPSFRFVLCWLEIKYIAIRHVHEICGTDS